MTSPSVNEDEGIFSLFFRDQPEGQRMIGKLILAFGTSYCSCQQDILVVVMCWHQVSDTFYVSLTTLMILYLHRKI